eukprot:scaffold5250_cov394-Prasinococcus_capsulatus_cf.AAC.7
MPLGAADAAHWPGEELAGAIASCSVVTLSRQLTPPSAAGGSEGGFDCPQRQAAPRELRATAPGATRRH